jgi:hypothetical protein
MFTPMHVLLAFLAIVLALITAALGGHEKGRWQYDQRLSG